MSPRPAGMLAAARRRLSGVVHRLGVTRTAYLDAERSTVAALRRDVETAAAAADRLRDEIDHLRRADRWPVGDPQTTDGVNVVGYLHHQLSLGDTGRRWVDVLREGGLPAAALAYGLVPAEPLRTRLPVDQRLEYADTLAVLPADQIAVLEWLHPEVRAASRRLVGYCYWEVEALTEPVRRGAAHVDEIWVHTRFIEDAFANGCDTPVHRVPVPVAEPRPSSLRRDDFPVLARFPGRPVFGVTFDWFSVAERKNPHGAIDAFTRAFAPDEGPVLVVKTLHGDRFPAEHAALAARAGGRADVVLWDEHLARADQLAFIGTLDGLVALHRAEGFGVHLGEAMWLGTPVIATGYSGNLDLMDESNSLLVGHTMTAIVDGGGIYPPGGRWAEPDLDHAAEQLRRLAGDPALRTRLAAAGRATMAAQPTAAEVAGDVARRLDLG